MGGRGRKSGKGLDQGRGGGEGRVLRRAVVFLFIYGMLREIKGTLFFAVFKSLFLALCVCVDIV